MTTFSNLSSLIRSLFDLWAFSLCLIIIINIVLSIWKRRIFFSILAVILLIPVYLSWQIIFDFALGEKTNIYKNITLSLTGIAWIWWFIVFIIFTISSLMLLIENVRHEKNNITPNSIKIYLDQIPCGICYYRDNGRVVFANICMEEICNKLIGVQLLNGNQFASAIKEEIIHIEDKVWRFASRNIEINNEQVHEIVAIDISNEYAKTEALQKDKTELSRVNQELKEYTLGIDDVIKHQEVLAAKVNIHDEMNRLMLSTMALDNKDVKELDNIFRLWEQNALLICMQADEAIEEKAVERIEELAKALKIKVIWKEMIPTSLNKEERILFFSAAHEAIANAVKHAKANKIEISFNETESSIECLFINDGDMPNNEVTFSGGLINLERLANNIGAKISISIKEEFTIKLIFFK